MDYQSLHGQDASNLSSPSQHRMPTVSAAQALQELQSPVSRGFSTGLAGLDAALQNRDVIANPSDAGILTGGVARGHVMEVYGPSGVGKTTLGLQIAVNALSAGQAVVWVDGASPIPGPRLQHMLSSAGTEEVENEKPSSPLEIPQSATNAIDRLIHFSTPSLPHLIALLCHPTPSFPPAETSLIVIDSLSSLFANAYPRHTDLSTSNTPLKQGNKNDPHHWAATRKWAVLQYLISALQKLAAVRNIAVVILNHTVTKMQSGSGAILIPAISSSAWDAGISTRIVLFRDWGWDEKQIHFAGVLKAMGTNITGRAGVGKVIAFAIEDIGLKEMVLPESAMLPVSPIVADSSRKRKADEIMDSEGEDEDYGWAEDDVEELPEATQNQGSEDILVPGPGDDGEEEEEHDEEEGTELGPEGDEEDELA